MSSTLDLDADNVVDIDLGSAEFKANAHRHMAEWARRPPFYVLGQGQPQVVVGRYADVHKVFSDTQTFASEMPRGPGWEQFNKIMDAQFVTQMDGEQHARVRRLLMPAFSSRRIEQLKESITGIVDGMLDRIEANGPAFDGMTDYGAHLVVDALLTAMVAMDERRKAIFTAFHDLIPGTTYVKPGESWSPELRRAFDRTMDEIRVIIDERRASPRPDFISDLVNARDAGDKLNDRELFDQIFGICGASLSATSRAAGGALYLLYTHDEQRAELIRESVAHPGGDRGMPAARQQRLLHLPAHRHARHRGGRHPHPQRHGGAAVAAGAELRPGRVSRSVALRHPPQAEAHPVVRRRPAPLHRQHPGAHHHHHRDHAAAGALSEGAHQRSGFPAALWRRRRRIAAAEPADAHSLRCSRLASPKRLE